MGSRPAAPTRSRGPIEPVDPGQHLRDAPFGRQCRPSPTRQASHARLPVPATQGAQRGQSDVGAALLSAHWGSEFGASDVLVANTKQGCSDSSNPSEHGHDRGRGHCSLTPVGVALVSTLS